MPSDTGAAPAEAPAEQREGMSHFAAAVEAPPEGSNAADSQIEGVIAASFAAVDEAEPDGDDGQAGGEVPPAVTDDDAAQGSSTPADEAEPEGPLAPALTASSGDTMGSRVISITADATSVAAQRAIQVCLQNRV